jgi:hypothetical protein
MESEMSDSKKGYTYSYYTKNARQAEVLSHLLKKVQKFQLFLWVQNFFDEIYEDNRLDIWTAHTKMLQYLDFVNSSGSYSTYNYIPGGNYPVNVYELDPNGENLNPCFYVREYKINDNMGPLYMYVMLTQNRPELETDFYHFDVRFIGSDEPLTEYISRIPIYDATQIYQQKRDEYTIANQDHINKVCQLIGSAKFRKALQTYPQGMICDRYGKPTDCGAYNSSTGMCVGNGNCMWKNTITHDGAPAYDQFCKTFGNEIGQMVKNGAFTKDNWDLMPDFTDMAFVDAFNRFCSRNGLNEYSIQNIFDPDLNIFNGFQSLDKYIKRIETWLQNPDSNIVPYVHSAHKGYILEIPTNQRENKRTAGIIKRVIRDTMEPHK